MENGKVRNGVKMEREYSGDDNRLSFTPYSTERLPCWFSLHHRRFGRLA